MYKPIEPIRCPKCGTTVNVNTSMISTSNPPCYKWTCPNCGEKGNTKLGVTATNADGNTAISAAPAWSVYANTNTRCIICDEEFKFDGEHRICPKCREAVMKVRKDIYDAKHNIGSDGCTVYCNPFNSPEVNVNDSVCATDSVSWSSRKTVDGDVKLTI